MILSNDELYFIGFLFAVLLAVGMILSLLAYKGQSDGSSLEQKLTEALPGVQCAQCGYIGCQEYAKALAQGQVECNKCIPGGPDTTLALAKILGVEPPAGDEGDDLIFMPRTVAHIHASICIGCGRCAKVCPVDAISGKLKQPFMVDAEECIGCSDCIKKCPEDCIELTRLAPGLENFNWDIKAMRITGGAGS